MHRPAHSHRKPNKCGPCGFSPRPRVNALRRWRQQDLGVSTEETARRTRLCSCGSGSGRASTTSVNSPIITDPHSSQSPITIETNSPGDKRRSQGTEPRRASYRRRGKTATSPPSMPLGPPGIASEADGELVTRTASRSESMKKREEPPRAPTSPPSMSLGPSGMAASEADGELLGVTIGVNEEESRPATRIGYRCFFMVFRCASDMCMHSDDRPCLSQLLPLPSHPPRLRPLPTQHSTPC